MLFRLFITSICVLSSVTFASSGPSEDDLKLIAEHQEIQQKAIDEGAYPAECNHEHDIAEAVEQKPKFTFAGALSFFSTNSTKKKSEGQKIWEQINAEIKKPNFKNCKVKSLGIPRANSVEDRCQPNRDVFSCHLVDKAVDAKFTGKTESGENCGPAIVKAIGANYVDYENMEHLHVGHWTFIPSCQSDTWGMAPGGSDNNWCACAKGKFGSDFKCDPKKFGPSGIIKELLIRKWPF